MLNPIFLYLTVLLKLNLLNYYYFFCRQLVLTVSFVLWSLQSLVLWTCGRKNSGKPFNISGPIRKPVTCLQFCVGQSGGRLQLGCVCFCCCWELPWSPMAESTDFRDKKTAQSWYFFIGGGGGWGGYIDTFWDN